MKKNYVTYKDKYNTKYGYKKNESHTLEEISKDTGVSIKGLQQIYNKGIGAYKTNPSSVRPNVKSKEQWAMARVYSAVMGGKASKIDSNELKMEKGGLIAPNGKKSNLTALQYKLVRTPEFKAWFGYWDLIVSGKAKNYQDEGIREIAHLLKQGDLSAIKKVAKFLSQQVSENDILIPMPSRKGCVTDNHSLLLSNEIAKISGAIVYSDLCGDERDSLYNMKKQNIDLKDVDLGLFLKSELPVGANYFIVDNVIGTGFSMYNAQLIVGNNAQPLVYAVDERNISKVVDENGEPLVVYRGSKSKNPNYTPNKHELSKGIYFSTKKDIAELYTTSVWQNWVGRVFDCFLNIKNIDYYDTLKFKSNIYQADFDFYNKLVVQSKKNNFDGIRWDNFIDVPDLQTIFPKEPIDYIASTFIVFEPEQIKLADGSNTTFDGKNPDIRFKKGGMTRRYAEGGKITQFEIESMRNYINSPNPNPKLKDSFEKVLRKFGVDLERSDLSDFTKGKYVNPYNFSGYEYMRKINEEAGVSFLLTGEYELVSKAIYEKDYAMWLFYSYLGRINISFKACENWLQQAQEYFEHTMPIPIWLVHTPNAKDGRSYAMWVAVSNENKAQAESRLGRPLVFEYEGRYYYQEIGMVANFDAKNSDGWGSLYKEKKTGLLIPEYTETSFHFNTLIHEFSHCLDFQTQLLKNIDKYDNKKAQKISGEIEINTQTMSDAELALYANQLRREEAKDNVVSLPITNHFDEFVDSLIRVLRACAGGHIPLTQLYEQQALDVQTALEGVYGDLLLEQRARREQERKEVEKADQMRENTRFSWQTSWINDIKKYALQNALQADLKEKLQSTGKNNFTLSEIIELDNLITQYFNMEFKKYMIQNPTKGSERLEDIKRLKQETNRIINNHYDNIKSGFQYGFQPQNELEYYISENCKLSDFRDYKSWKDCVKEKLEKFG